MIKGHVFKYGANVDTDVIIPARYLNVSEAQELAKHCMEDIDKDFIRKVKPGDIIVATTNFDRVHRMAVAPRGRQGVRLGKPECSRRDVGSKPSRSRAAAVATWAETAS